MLRPASRAIHATACAVSSAGMIPSYLAEQLQRADDVLVADGVVLRSAALREVRVLGSDARVVQARGDRVGLFDLTELVLHQERAHAVQDAR